MKSINQLISYYEQGIITENELFVRVRDEGLGLQLSEKYWQAYETWDKTHPEEECLNFSIIANDRKSEKIQDLKKEFEAFVRSYNPSQNDLNVIFRDWVFGKLASLEI